MEAASALGPGRRRSLSGQSAPPVSLAASPDVAAVSGVCLPTLWAFAYAITILLFILSRLIPLPDNLAVHSLFPPEFTGMLLGLMCLLQFVASLYIERRYEKKVAKSLFWVIWFPMVYWMIGLLTTLVAFPKVMVKRQRSRARWVSPDRGKGSL